MKIGTHFDIMIRFYSYFLLKYSFLVSILVTQGHCSFSVATFLVTCRRRRISWIDKDRRIGSRISRRDCNLNECEAGEKKELQL